jgi:hypothetical protein
MSARVLPAVWTLHDGAFPSAQTPRDPAPVSSYGHGFPPRGSAYLLSGRRMNAEMLRASLWFKKVAVPPWAEVPLEVPRRCRSYAASGGCSRERSGRVWLSKIS